MEPVARTMLHKLEAQAERLGDRPALWTRRDGGWVPTSWRQYLQRVKWLALGLHRLGLRKGQALAVLAGNREEWLVADLAAMALGAVPVGLYTTASQEQIEYVVGHCEASILVAEGGRFLPQVSAARARLPKLQKVIFMDMPPAAPEGSVSYEQVLLLGKTADQAVFRDSVSALEPNALATLIYTSGTTGHPKGVMLSHRNLTWTAVHLSRAASLGENETILSYLPLSHIAEQVCSIYGPITNGMQVYFAESLDDLAKNLREVRPTAFFGVPRVWEKFMAKAQESMRALPAHRRAVLAWARHVGGLYHDFALAGRRVPLSVQGQYELARRVVFAPFKARIGFDRTRIFATSAAPIGKDVLEFFASVDMVIREVYGQSEVTGPTTVNSQTHTRLGTLGRPMDGVEVRIAPDGEILARGENTCLGYYQNPEATAELLKEGWLHSGDVGEFDRDGYLRITGRKKEIIVTSGGKKTPPATLEALLKAIDPLGNALVIGDGRHYLVALLALDPEKLPAFSKEHDLPAEAARLASDPRFLRYLTERIESEVNPKVARFETIKKFAVLPRDFTVETGELTATLKVRRKVCEEKYRQIIEGLYAS